MMRTLWLKIKYCWLYPRCAYCEERTDRRKMQRRAGLLFCSRKCWDAYDWCREWKPSK